jgi:hypothetical protein
MIVGNVAFVVDVQSESSMLSKEAKDDIRKAWQEYELGNDWCYLPAEYMLEDCDENEIDSYPHFRAWYTEHFEAGSNVLIHYWW